AKYTTQQFDVLAVITQDGSVDFTETIAITFTERQRGIIRKLPFRTKSGDGAVREVEYQLLGVEADQGSGFQPVEALPQEQGGDWQVRIGSQNTWLTGRITYRIHYTIAGALTPIEKNDSLGRRVEFLWNLLPTDWPTEIPQSNIVVQWPTPEQGRLVARVLAGPRGTRQGIQVERGASQVGRSEFIDVQLTSDIELLVRLKQALPAGYVVTADVALPGNTVTASAPNITRRNAKSGSLLPNFKPGPSWLGLLPLIPGLIIFFIAKRLWPGRERPLVVRFDAPQGLGPSLSGTIIDGQVNPRDVVAGIVSLAQKGALKLHHPIQEGAGIQIELLGLERAKDVPYIEQQLYTRLSEYGTVISPDMLRGTFGDQYQILAAMLRQEGVDRGYFAKSAASKGSLGCLLIFLVVFATFALCLFQPVFTIMGAAAALLLGFIGIARISDVTPLGQEVRRDLEGLREFITRANEKEMNYMADRDPDQSLFERLLPYAIAFDAVQQWTKAFEGIDLQMPDWYDAPMGNDMFWTYMLLNDLTSFGNDYGDAMSFTAPTSGFESGGLFSSGESGFGDSGWSDSGGGGFDGGFSGGDGGGGGGGDSW
ncbi:MAG: DUF2207 domain-containing protein, partial [Fimbriimonas sp.]